MKARIDNLASINGSDVLDGTVVDADAQRQSNYEIIQGTNLESLLPTYKDSPEQLSKLITPNTLNPMANGATWKNWSLLNQDKFTIHSRSLPVDVANGKLKKDLTAYIKGTYTGLDDQPIIDPRFNIAATKTPNFDLIKQWANLVDDHTTPQPVTAPISESSGQQVGLHPVLTQGAVAMQHSYEIIGADSVKAVFMLMPQIQLWNPHNVPLEAQDYIVQVGYSFDWWMQATGTRNTEKFTWSAGNPRLRSWIASSNHPALPVHKPADNENINYQTSKRFFTFVIKSQAFEAGELLVFYAKPPTSGPISGVPYNINTNADTDILDNFSSDQQLNLLVNEGTLDEFFYFSPESIGTTTNNGTKSKISAGPLRMERNFRSRAALSGNNVPEEENNTHLNLYTVENGNPLLIHAIKKPQRNERFGNWQAPTYPFKMYQDGSLLASETLFYKDSLINIGSSMLASKFDIFAGGSNMNLPPKAGQPHSVLNQWNIRNQESFSSSEAWGSSDPASSWLNTFSFRDIANFLNTWEFTDNHYANSSMDRLGGWWLSQVQDMTYPFFDYPAGEFGPLSLGSFQHANLSLYGWQPTYAFGNSQAPTRFDRQEYKSSTHDDMFDLSYVLNTSLWDSYYLSSIPQSGATLTDRMRLPNSSMSLSVDTDSISNLTNDQGFELSAAHVFINGGFNVNSTSQSAWKAFLSGALGQNIEAIEGGDSHDTSATAMGRFLSPLVDEPSTVAADRSTTEFDTPQGWASTRTLNAAELEALSSRLVQEVKLRGPFLSLSDFVNRRREPESTISGDEQVYQEVLGTIQAAINKVSIEDDLINGHYFNNTSGQVLTLKPNQDWVTNLSFSVDDINTEAMFGYPISKINSKGGIIHNYAPGFLSQADVLTKIGPSITVRGDTFTIRAYGDSVDSAGNILAKAWCEAVVQRIAQPSEWDGSDAKLIQPNAPNETGFGRRFQIINFRWLNEKEVKPFSDDDSII